MGRPSTYPPAAGRTFFTAEESARFHALRVRLCSKRAALKALGCNELMFDLATGQGRVLPKTRARLLEKLERLERGEAAA
jgi:hypothetical protein